MTKHEIVEAIPDQVNVGAKTMRVDGEPGWLIFWGRGQPKRSLMIKDEGLTPETLRQAVADAGS